MPTPGVIAAAALASVLYLAGERIVNGVEKAGHAVGTTAVRMVKHRPGI